MTTTARTNRYPSQCTDCHQHVPAGAGHLVKAADGWIVRCADCAALTDAQRDARATAAATPAPDQAARAAEMAYLEQQGFSLFDPDAVLHAALVEGGFTNPVSVSAPAPAKASRRRTGSTRRTRGARRACVSGGNCSSTTGRDCGGWDCDAN